MGPVQYTLQIHTYIHTLPVAVVGYLEVSAELFNDSIELEICEGLKVKIRCLDTNP